MNLSRLLFGPVGAFCAFLFVATLVVGGLGWVTVAALNVEDSQFEAQAAAERANKERLALWRLDGLMLPTVGLENNRPFAHYTALHTAYPAVESVQDIANTFSLRLPSPLLSAELPNWMPLHFQIDPETGWDSPQVLPADVAERLRGGPNFLSLLNITPEREQRLQQLRVKFPAEVVLRTLADRDRAVSDESFFIVPVPLTNDASMPKRPGVSVGDPEPGQSRGPGAGNNLFSMLSGREVVHAGNTPASFGRSNTTVVTNNPLANPGEGAGQTVTNRGMLNDASNQFSPPTQLAAQGMGTTANPTGRGNVRNTNELGNDEYQARQRATKQNLDRTGGFEPQQQKGGQSGVPPLSQANEKADETSHDRKANSTPAKPAQPEAMKNNPEVKGLEAKKIADAPTPPPAPSGPGGFGGGVPGAGGGGSGGPLGGAEEGRKEMALNKFVKGKAIPPGAKDQPHDGDLASAVRSKLLMDELGPSARGSKKAAPTIQPVAVHVGPLRPEWLTADDGSEILVLVRAARLENKTVYQGVLLDWAKVQQTLTEQVADLFPAATVSPIRTPSDLSPERAMTALPVQLDPGNPPELPAAGVTPLRLGLILAWVASVIALFAVGFGGRALLDLSERRIRFVSAVTHELRTPLTSLRLYLDLLTSGMIEDPDQQKEYLHTLSDQSERLNRLIENVLDFARLEKRSVQATLQPTNVSELLDQIRQTWSDRCLAEGKDLVVLSTVPVTQTVSTDARMATQILGNLIDNARKYSRDAADNRIWLWAKPGKRGRVIFEVEDRGPGVAARERALIFRPFRRGEIADTTAGGAGLGLALAQHWAELLGGKLTYRPADGGTGACFRLELPGTNSAKPILTGP